MRLFAFLSLILFGLTACSSDESVAAYGGADHLWQLESLDGAPFAARATLRFGDGGAITGQGPCNSYRARQTAPYPWFALGTLVQTRAACPDLAAEATFFAGLAEMSQSEVSGRVLRLSNDAGREMIFHAAPTNTDLTH